MNKRKKWWMPVLLACLLMAILVGMAGARPNARPLAAAPNKHGISVFHCIPVGNTVDWEYDRNDLQCNTPPCQFYCPLDPPLKGTFAVRLVGMFAFDNSAGEVCMTLRQHRPNKGNAPTRLGPVCTSDSLNDPQVVVADPTDFVVPPMHDVYAYVTISGTAQEVYGFKLRYLPL